MSGACGRLHNMQHLTPNKEWPHPREARWKGIGHLACNVSIWVQITAAAASVSFQSLSSHQCSRCKACQATLRVSIGGYHALLAALLLAFCASPAFCRGRSLLQMQNMPAAGQFPLFGQPKLTADQVRMPAGTRSNEAPLQPVHDACVRALWTLGRVPGCKCACRLGTIASAAACQGGAAPPRGPPAAPLPDSPPLFR